MKEKYKLSIFLITLASSSAMACSVPIHTGNSYQDQQLDQLFQLCRQQESASMNASMMQQAAIQQSYGGMYHQNQQQPMLIYRPPIQNNYYNH